MVSYELPSLKHLEEFFFAPSRKKSSLHRIKPVHHVKLTSGKVLGIVSGDFSGKLVYSSLSIQLPGNLNSSECAFILTLWSGDLSVLWNRTFTSQIPPSHIWRTPRFDVRKIPVAMLITSQCVLTSKNYCGLLFLGFPSLEENEYHFSTVALSLESGETVWHHLPKDFEESKPRNEDEHIWKHWKMRLVERYQTHGHIGESPWEAYRESLVQTMPIEWYGGNDAKFKLININTILGTVTPPKSELRANGIVVLHPKGIDLLELSSGRPLARLPIDWKPGSTYANIPLLNQSRLLSRTLTSSGLRRIHIASALVPHSSASFRVHINDERSESDKSESSVDRGDFSRTVDCRGLLYSLESQLTKTSNGGGESNSEAVPRGQSVMYTGLCRPHGMLEYPRLGRTDWLEDEKKSVPPIVLPRNSPSEGLSSLLYSILLTSSDDEYGVAKGDASDSHDIFFLASDGSLTSVSNFGYENWRVNAEVSWLQISRTVAASYPGRPADPQLHELYTNQFRPSLWSTDLVPFGVGLFSRGAMLASRLKGGSVSFSGSTPALHVIVATGWDSVSIVDRATGELLATHRLPTHPVGQPILLPLRYTDDARSPAVGSVFIIPCDGMLLAFGVTCSVRFTTLVLIVLCLISLFILLNTCCSSGNPD
ncbi:unnamed protein product [Calicophoron daubneyi]|uniref:Uncharacterized protein n=1 Tax=Calicophoron daubneyi TaxID=300641 RepID=A0AAV2TIQ0_CALDB